ALAQQHAKLPVVGVLTPHLLDPAYAAFGERLRELGHEDGRTMRVLVRSADAKLDQLGQLAAELVRAKVDVIVAINTPGSRAAINATKEIPIGYGDRWRSRRDRVRQQPCASGRECHWHLKYVR